MSGLETIEFLERMGDMLDEDVKTEEFCNEFTWAMNRVRYEVRKSVPVPVKWRVGKFTSYFCGQCSHTINAWDKFCPECGRKIKW